VGWSFNGACLKDNAAAKAHFDNAYPTAQADTISQVTASSVSASGVLSYTIQTDDLTNNKTTTNTATLQLKTCDYNDVTLGEDYGFTLLIGCVILFGLGFIGTR